MERARKVLLILSYILWRKNLLREESTPQGHVVKSGVPCFLMLSPGLCQNCTGMGLASGSCFSLAIVYCSYLRDSGCEISLVSVVWFGLELPFHWIALFFSSCEFAWEGGMLTLLVRGRSLESRVLKKKIPSFPSLSAFCPSFVIHFKQNVVVARVLRGYLTPG